MLITIQNDQNGDNLQVSTKAYRHTEMTITFIIQALRTITLSCINRSLACTLSFINFLLTDKYVT